MFINDGALKKNKTLQLKAKHDFQLPQSQPSNSAEKTAGSKMKLQKSIHDMKINSRGCHAAVPVCGVRFPLLFYARWKMDAFDCWDGGLRLSTAAFCVAKSLSLALRDVLFLWSLVFFSVSPHWLSFSLLLFPSSAVSFLAPVPSLCPLCVTSATFRR